jgi:hypothetical protein
MLQWIWRRPLSSLTAAAAVLVILLELAKVSQGQLYEKSLGGIDRTTLTELAMLGLWGIVRLRQQTDLQAVSFTLVSGLSFIFGYEALYKWSFYMAPFRLEIPPAELRLLVIQIGITLAILTGFAVGIFRLTGWTAAWAVLFALMWVVWIAVGFPQISGKVVWPALLPVTLAYWQIYLINRLTKTALWLGYLSIFPPAKPAQGRASPLRIDKIGAG